MKLKLAACSFVVFFLGAAGGAWGSAAQIVDLDTTERQGNSTFLSDSTQRFGRLYFAATDSFHGSELWASNGTDARTYLVRDLCPGPCGSFPRRFLAFNNKVYFTADDGVFGNELWASDGSAGGTYLVRDLCPGPCSAFSTGTSSQWVRFKDQLYFVASDGQRPPEVWRTDGTREGTQPAFEVCPGFCQTSPRILTATDEKLFVAGSDLNGFGLWASDGTVAGTARLASCGLCGSPQTVGDEIFFLNDDGAHGRELWHSDGTPAGTGLFIDACSGTCDGATSGSLAVLRDRVYFAGRLEEGRTTALLRLGAAPGQIETVAGFPAVSNVRNPTSNGDLIYFIASSPGVGAELFFTDGLAAPVRVRELDQIEPNDGVSSPVPATDRVFFIVNKQQLWTATSGQTGAQHLLTLPRPQSSSDTIRSLTSLSQRVLMVGYTPEAFWEPWSSDGTQAGTRMLADIYRDPGSSNPFPIARLGEQIVFGAASDGDETGLWISGGDAASTEPLGVGPSRTAELFPVAEGLLYSALDSYVDEPGLWLTDGTAAGTRLVTPDLWSARGFTRIGERVFFSADGGDGEEPWVTDLTAAGTLSLGDLAPGYVGVQPPLPPASSFPSDFVAAQETILFAAYGEDVGRELWQTDGTEAGTVLFADLCTGACSSAPAWLTPFAEAIYFAATDGEAGQELWRTDGTVDGTAQLIDLRPGSEGSHPHHFSLLGGELLFFADRDGQGEGLWASDGTAEGIRLVRDLGLGDRSSFVTAAQLAAGHLFFVVANTTTGPELWASDGTTAGTGLVEEIGPGAQGAYPQELTAIGDRLMFAATDGESGLELWTSDGTAEGTERLADVAAGASASSPSELTAVGDQLVFAADDGVSGRELWSVDLPEPTLCEECLLDGRFRISVEWQDPHQPGNQGVGYAIPYSEETLLFWFFSPSNLELVVKMLDGRSENGYFWVFYGALTDVEYWITVEDQLTGAMRTYHSPPGQVCGQADTQAFAGSADAPASIERRKPLPLDLVLSELLAANDDLAANGVPLAANVGPSAANAGPPTANVGPLAANVGPLAANVGPLAANVGPLAGNDEPNAIIPCNAGPNTLCLRDDRFTVEVEWRNQHDGGSEGMGHALPATDETGFFWFFSEQNLELAVKILDGRAINGKFWVLYGALSDLEYELTVSDWFLGAERIYHNPPGEVCGRADIDAF